ncbi:MAG: hypothetical protein RLW87_20320 [Alphaproteobacteria bacterium]
MTWNINRLAGKPHDRKRYASVAVLIAAVTALGLGTIRPAQAQMAVIDQTNLVQAIEAVSAANKTLAEVKKHTEIFNSITRGIGTGGLGVLTNAIGLRQSGLGDLLDEARGMCYAVNDLLNTKLPSGLPEIGLPKFTNGCAGFNWAGQTFFTPPPEMTDDWISASRELRRRRTVFYDANIQQAVNSGMTHRERVKDTAETISDLRANVEAVQASEDSDASSLRHAVTANSLVLLHLLEETAAVREILADTLLVLSSAELKQQTISEDLTAPDGEGKPVGFQDDEETGTGGGSVWVPPGLGQ